MKKTIFLIICLLTLISCGGKKDSSSAKFAVDLSALTGALSTADGGVLLAGRSIDDKYSISKALKVGDPDLVLELPNGEWEFYMVAWDGGANTKILEGQTKCSYSGTHNLNGEDVNVSFQLLSSNCALPLPGDNDLFSEFTQPGGSWPKTKFLSCLDVDEATPNCTGTGLTASYRVTLGIEIDGVQIPGAHELVSECKLISDTNYLTLPSGDNLGGGFTPRAFFYTSSDCSGPEVFYDFREGFIKGSEGTGPSYPNYTDSTAANVLAGANLQIYFEHNTETPIGIGPNPLQVFGTGEEGAGSTISNFNYPVTNFSPDGYSVNIPNTGGTFSAGDEIMWYVSEFQSSPSDCGPLKTGEYGFQRIKSSTISGSEMLEFYKSVREGVDLTDGNLINYANCKIQIIKVPNYDTLNISSLSSPDTYSGGLGGIVVARVRDTLTLSGTISANDSGHMTAVNFTPGSYVDYTQCNDRKKCLKMGRGNISNNGGGIILLFARNIDFTSGSAAIQANTSAPSAEGGTIEIVAENIFASTSATNISAANLSANGTLPPFYGVADVNLTATAPGDLYGGMFFNSDTTAGAMHSDFLMLGTTASGIQMQYYKEFNGMYYDYSIWQNQFPHRGLVNFNYCSIDSSSMGVSSNISDVPATGDNFYSPVHFNPTNELCFD